jgi:hypothetical protein
MTKNQGLAARRGFREDNGVAARMERVQQGAKIEFASQGPHTGNDGAHWQLQLLQRQNSQDLAQFGVKRRPQRPGRHPKHLFLTTDN